MTTALKKSYVNNVTISLGLLSVTGNIYSPTKVNAKKDEQFKMACPLHPDTPHGVKQRYVCEQEHDNIFEPSDCLSARVDGDKWTIVNKDDIAAAKASDLEPRKLELTAHPYDPMTTFASGGAHVFLPSEVDSGVYAAFLELVDERGVVETDDGPQMLCGIVSLRKGSETFERLERWGDQLVLRELVRPQDVDEFQKIDTDVSVKELDMARQLIATLSEEFDADRYKSSIRERIVALAESGESGEVPAFKAKTEKEDLSSLLARSLEIAKEK